MCEVLTGLMDEAPRCSPGTRRVSSSGLCSCLRITLTLPSATDPVKLRLKAAGCSVGTFHTSTL